MTSDSLAGESIEGGGSFGANSDARGPMSQKSAGTTANNTDTSGATTLDAAPSADAREAQEGWSESASMNAGQSLGGSGGSGGNSGSGTAQSYAGAAGGSSSIGGGSSGSENVPPTGSGQPKGANIAEGGFSSNDPNASFETDIGGKNDPGRAALGAMEAGNTPSAGGTGPRQEQVTNDGQFDSLGETSA